LIHKTGPGGLYPQFLRHFSAGFLQQTRTYHQHGYLGPEQCSSPNDVGWSFIRIHFSNKKNAKVIATDSESLSGLAPTRQGLDGGS
jgi:hypothetical protein